jgi:hypothetical protein
MPSVKINFAFYKTRALTRLMAHLYGEHSAISQRNRSHVHAQGIARTGGPMSTLALLQNAYDAVLAEDSRRRTAATKNTGKLVMIPAMVERATSQSAGIVSCCR